MRFRGSALVALSIVSASSFAQSQLSATSLPVKITVLDQSGAVIPGAEVKIDAPVAPVTDAMGQTVLNFSVGKYELLATAQGFRPLKKLVDVTAAGAQNVEFTLTVGSYSGPVVVAEDPNKTPRTTNPALSATVDSDTLGITLPGQHPQTLNAAALKAMPHQSVTFHNVHTKANETYSGVRLSQLLSSYGVPTGDKLRGKAMSDYVVATGSDGYRAVLALAETDPAFHPGDVIVADSMDGKPLDAKEGPFKLVVTEDKRPARSVHNLVSIELKTLD